MSINWDNFKRPESGDFPERWRPETAGDKISGKIQAIRIATMPDGNQYPSLTLDVNGVQREVLASQSMLLQRLAALQPNLGDVITIEFTQMEKLAGGKTLKHFTITVDSATPRTESIL
jgi:hypothetical protein